MAQKMLGRRMPLLRGQAVPLCRIGVVPGHSQALRIEPAQFVLRLDVALVRRLAVPARGLGVVEPRADSLGIPPSELVLCLGVSLLGGPLLLERAGRLRRSPGGAGL